MSYSSGVELRRRRRPKSATTHQALADLGVRLRYLRQDAGLSGRALAQLAGWYPSKVSRIENGLQVPSVEDIRAWCHHSGVGPRADELVASLRALEGLYIEWHRHDQAGLASLQESIVPLWQRTRVFRFYSPFLVPTPLQTADYARALLSGIRDRRGTVDDAVVVRLGRQEIVHDRSRRFIVVLEESALRYATGSAQTMAGQLGHLLHVGALANVSLGVVPQNADRSATRPAEEFFLYDDDHVLVEVISGELTITEPAGVGLYEAMFRDLSALAARGAAARVLITSAIRALDP